MLFNSFSYLALFIITYTIYWNIKDEFKKSLLLISSLIFYSFFSIPFLFHFVAVVGFNYLLSLRLWDLKERGENTQSTINLVVVLNLINLIFFKYFYLITDFLYSITGAPVLSHDHIRDSIHIILPLAISFYTFQLLALQIDIHRGVEKERISLHDYYLFIFFFPQMIAGPIMRTQDFLPQINSPTIDSDRMKQGLFLIISGVIKKSIIAEGLSSIIYPMFSNPSAYSVGSIYLGVIGFGFQVYCDFSGYTDIARGSAFLLGYSIPENFLGPFLSKSFREVWTRWHITLSTWLRDYLYIPLGGNTKRANINMLLTMGLGGLWHGANFAYFFWGFYLGVFLLVERFLFKFNGNKRLLPEGRNWEWVRFFIIFHLFIASGIFFRAGTMGDQALPTVWKVVVALFTLQSGESLPRIQEVPLLVLGGFFFNAVQYYPQIVAKFKPHQDRILWASAVVLTMVIMGQGDTGGDFIYFQF